MGAGTGTSPFDDPMVTNIAFGGPDLTTAFVTLSGSGRLVAVDWDTPGLRPRVRCLIMEIGLNYGRGTLAVGLPDDLDVTVVTKRPMQVLADPSAAVSGRARPSGRLAASRRGVTWCAQRLHPRL